MKSARYSQQSASFERKQRRRKIVGYVAGAVSVAVWIFVFVRLSSITTLSINTISVYGAPQEITGAIQSAAYRTIEGDYAGLFSRANSLIYPKSEIVAAIGALSPAVDDVKVKLDGMNNLAISISEKIPAAVVCTGLPDLSDTDTPSNQDCYLTDSKGLIFAPVGSADTKSYNRYYIPDLPDRKVAGMYATTTQGFRAIQNFVETLKSADIEVLSTLMADLGNFEVYAHNPDSYSVVVIHATDVAGLDKQAENLVLFWRRMVAESRAKKTHLEWDEIKLQYPPNVYYTEVKQNR